MPADDGTFMATGRLSLEIHTQGQTMMIRKVNLSFYEMATPSLKIKASSKM
jgi:hypothetical protein